MVRANLEPNWDANRMRWDSPPESVLACRFSSKYPNRLPVETAIWIDFQQWLLNNGMLSGFQVTPDQIEGIHLQWEYRHGNAFVSNRDGYGWL